MHSKSVFVVPFRPGNVFMNLFFDGPEEEGDALVNEFVSKTTPIVKNISRMRYDEYVELIAHEKAAPNGLYYYVPGVYFPLGRYLCTAVLHKETSADRRPSDEFKLIDSLIVLLHYLLALLRQNILFYHSVTLVFQAI